MRLFLAIELPGQVRAAIASLSEPLAKFGVAPRCFTRRENLHVTLKFLGEVGAPELPALCEALKAAADCHCFSIQPATIIPLPERGPIRIISIGFTGDLKQLEDLHQTIEAACEPLGFEPEARRFRPHITCARLRQPMHGSARKRLQEASFAQLPQPAFEVCEMVLMESVLEATGARYVPLARFPLRSMAGDE
jgi:2'-5' RNA ligase